MYKVGQVDILSKNCVLLSVEWMLQIQGWPFLAVNMTKLSDILSKVLIQKSKANGWFPSSSWVKDDIPVLSMNEFVPKKITT